MKGGYTWVGDKSGSSFFDFSRMSLLAPGGQLILALMPPALKDYINANILTTFLLQTLKFGVKPPRWMLLANPLVFLPMVPSHQAPPTWFSVETSLASAEVLKTSLKTAFVDLIIYSLLVWSSHLSCRLEFQSFTSSAPCGTLTELQLMSPNE